MEMTREQELINRYFDGDLNKEEEVFLFTQLSSDEESREYFKSLNLLGEAVKQTVEEVPYEIDEKLLRSLSGQNIQHKNSSSYFNLPAVISYSVSMILLVLTFFIYSELTSYKEQMDYKIQQVNQQGKMIELLFNSLPTTVVSSTLENEIIITPAM